jgi:hypothetical protein
MLNQDKFRSKQVDPSANSKGKAGVLPYIEGVEKAIVTLNDDIFAQMVKEYHSGREKGQTTHNKYLDPYFKWMPGYTSVITGWPGHGKSQLFFELLLLRAVFKGKKSVIWPSENMPAKRFFQGIIHTFTGRPTDKSQANHLSEAEYRRAAEYVREHIILLDPPTGMPYTPSHMLAYCEAAIAKYGGAQDKFGIAHCLLDPWNKQDHTAKAKMGGDEPYLVHTVGLCTKWSMDTGQSLVLTAHPKRENENMGYGKSRPVPNGGTISGGQTWENMAHYVGAMHRPFDWIEGNTQAAFYSHKCKDERDVAKRGCLGYQVDGTVPLVPINWDEITNRYRWGHDRFSPLDSPEVAKLWAAPAAAPAPQLFTEPAKPTQSQPLRTSSDTGTGFEAEAPAPVERFGPRQITSADLPNRS